MIYAEGYEDATGSGREKRRHHSKRGGKDAKKEGDSGRQNHSHRGTVTEGDGITVTVAKDRGLLSTFGYMLGDRKMKDFKDFLETCKANGVHCHEVALNSTLKTLPQYDVLLHDKFNMIAKRKDADTKEKKDHHLFSEYLARWPQMLVLDPMSNVQELTKRYDTYEMARKQWTIASSVYVPPFVKINKDLSLEAVLRRVRESDLHFPMVGKPDRADKHEMRLVFNEKGLCDFAKRRTSYVLQEFVAHSAVLHKIYVLGKASFSVVTRPSLKTFTADSTKETVVFHTWDVSKPDCSSKLNPEPAVFHEHAKTKLDLTRLKELVERLWDTSRLTLVGIDVLVEEASPHRYAIIDVNYFPGYTGVKDVGIKLYNHVVDSFARHTAAAGQPPAPPKTAVAAALPVQPTKTAEKDVAAADKHVAPKTAAATDAKKEIAADNKATQKSATPMPAEKEVVAADSHEAPKAVTAAATHAEKDTTADKTAVPKASTTPADKEVKLDKNEAPKPVPAPEKDAVADGHASPKTGAHGGGASPKTGAHGGGASPKTGAHGGGASPKTGAHGGGADDANKPHQAPAKSPKEVKSVYADAHYYGGVHMATNKSQYAADADKGQQPRKMAHNHSEAIAIPGSKPPTGKGGSVYLMRK